MFGEKLRTQLKGYILAMSRYPLVVLFLLATASVNFYTIQTETFDIPKILFSLFIGAVLGAVAQVVYEHFFSKEKEKFIIYGSALALALGYHLILYYASINEIEMGIKTGVLTFALLIVFIWIPSIKSKIDFNQTFVAAVKALFTTILFTLVLTIGINIIIFAVDHLLFDIDGRVYSHVMNILFVLFFPLFFLSLIPRYPGLRKIGETDSESVAKAIRIPNLFSILLSYIVIPLVGMYTLILMIYILLNIRSDFWSDNLLEPLLVSYAITVIVLTILVSGIDNAFTNLYRKVVPKILIPIVLLQMIASIMKISELGLTHGRYYVILFGLFSLITAIVFSVYPVKKSGWIAMVLIVITTISIIPPIDAFTVSRASHIKLLKTTLLEHDMLVDEKVIPKSDLPKESQKKISANINYLSDMDYIKDIDWLPKDLSYDYKFKDTFGFNFTYTSDVQEEKYTYLEWMNESSMEVGGYDRMFHLSVANESRYEPSNRINFEVNEQSYILSNENKSNTLAILQKDDTLIQIDMIKLLDQILARGNPIDVESATVIEENEQVKLAITVLSANKYNDTYFGEVYVLVKIK